MLLINGVKRLGFIGGILEKFVGYCLVAVLLVFVVGFPVGGGLFSFGVFVLRKTGSSDYFGT
jgi:hypothetical protein